MVNINDIKLMNETMILYLKKMGKSSKRNEIIADILKDSECFLKITKEEAFSILEDIGISKADVKKYISNYLTNRKKKFIILSVM